MKMYDTANFTSFSDKTLYARALIDVPYNADVRLLDSRHSGAVHVTGVAFDWRFKVASEYGGSPMIIRWAVLCNKEDQTATDTSTGLPVTGFFKHRSLQSITEPARDFVPTDSSLTMDQLQINPEAYIIMDQGKILLQKNSPGVYDDPTQVLNRPTSNIANPYAGGGLSMISYYGSVKRYYPLNSQVRFDSNVAEERWPVDRNVYFVYWAFRTDKLTTQSTPSAELMQCHTRQCYFREHDII